MYALAGGDGDENSGVCVFEAFFVLPLQISK
jgi:hypothetical protein